MIKKSPLIPDFQTAVKQVQSKLQNYQPHRIHHEGVKRSAVMILFINKQSVPHIIFTRRTEWVENHKGQISFPGGMQDENDVDLRYTARRETFEEIGIRPEQINILGQLDDFFTVTNFIVTPFAGYVTNDFAYQINEREVAKVLEVPLEVFLRSDKFEVKKWPYKNQIYDVFFYYYEQEVIWGVTAFILNRFIDLVFHYNPAPTSLTLDTRQVKI